MPGERTIFFLVVLISVITIRYCAPRKDLYHFPSNYDQWFEVETIHDKIMPLRSVTVEQIISSCFGKIGDPGELPDMTLSYQLCHPMSNCDTVWKATLYIEQWDFYFSTTEDEFRELAIEKTYKLFYREYCGIPTNGY